MGRNEGKLVAKQSRKVTVSCINFKYINNIFYVYIRNIFFANPLPLSQLSTAGAGRSSSKRSAPPEHSIETGEDMLAGQKAFRGYGKRDDKVNIYLH